MDRPCIAPGIPGRELQFRNRATQRGNWQPRQPGSKAESCPLLRLPERYGTVAPSRSDRFSIGTEHGMPYIVAPREPDIQQFGARLQFPYLNLPIKAGGNQAAAVGMEGYTRDRGRMTAQGPADTAG